jgi:peptidoglycan-N-acetylglucosamine deacetylase
MLEERNLCGSFYVPLLGYDGRPTMGPGSLRALAAQGHELGAHGVSHHTLPKFRAKELTREVQLCKTHLEDSVGEEVLMFCYPKGRYSARVIHEVKKAGYAGARTTEMLGHRLNFDPYRMSTTIQVYPHKKTQYLRNMGRAFHPGRALYFAADLRRACDWVELAKATFDRVLQDGGVWHLYGHSWEIEELNLWGDLAIVLGYVSKRPDVIYVTNREVLKFLPAHKRILSNAAGYCKDESLPRP